MYYYAKPKDKKPLGFIPLWDCKVSQTDSSGGVCSKLNSAALLGGAERGSRVSKLFRSESPGPPHVLHGYDIAQGEMAFNRSAELCLTTQQELNEWVEVLRKCVRDDTKARKNKVTSFWQRAFGNDVSVKVR